MYRSLEELCRMERETGKPFWKIVQEDDCVEQGISAEESFAQMRGMYQAMQYADAHYDETLKSASGLVGTEGTRMKRAREAGTLLCGDFIGKVMEKALKTSESNACMKRIVAAPTAGSCGVVPAVFLSVQEERGFSEECMVEALVCGSRNRRRDCKPGVFGRRGRRLSGGDWFGFRDGGRWCDVSSGRRCR